MKTCLSTACALTWWSGADADAVAEAEVGVAAWCGWQGAASSRSKPASTAPAPAASPGLDPASTDSSAAPVGTTTAQRSAHSAQVGDARGASATERAQRASSQTRLTLDEAAGGAVQQQVRRHGLLPRCDAVVEEAHVQPWVRPRVPEAVRAVHEPVLRGAPCHQVVQALPARGGGRRGQQNTSAEQGPGAAAGGVRASGRPLTWPRPPACPSAPAAGRRRAAAPSCSRGRWPPSR